MKIKLLFISIFVGGATLFFYNNSFFQSGRHISSTKSKGFHRWMPADWMWFSLGRQVEPKGPVHKIGEDTQYIRRVFGILIQEADKLSRDDWYMETVPNRTYLDSGKPLPFVCENSQAFSSGISVQA